MDEKIEIIKRYIKEFQDNFSHNLNKEIRDWGEIKDIVQFLINGYGDGAIVDFIDLSNWDSVETFEFDDTTRSLSLTWHDFKIPDNDFEISFFGFHLLKADILIDSIVITLCKGLPVLLLKGYYQDSKKLNLKYNTKCSNIEYFNDHPFSVEILRVVKQKRQSITVPNINCFTISIFPRYSAVISPEDSKDTLYNYNIHIASEKILELISNISELDASNQEELEQIGNSARKTFEYALKIIGLRDRATYEKDYQKLMLGDLTSVLKNLGFSKSLNFSLQNTVDTLNACSHDSGIFIKKGEVYKSLLFIAAAINKN
jgi:hypothetical protein